MYLKKDDLVLRQATPNDAEQLYAWWGDGKIMAHAGFPNGLNTDINILRNRLSQNRENSKTLIIEINSNPVGEMSFRIVDGTSEIGIKICDFSYHEKGYGTKALKMLISYLFDEMNVDKIVLDTNLTNTRAQHVYENLGFKKVAIKMNVWTNQLGELQSSVDYELTPNLVNCSN